MRQLKCVHETCAYADVFPKILDTCVAALLYATLQCALPCCATLAVTQSIRPPKTLALAGNATLVVCARVNV
jgi:hypothetical protein